MGFHTLIMRTDLAILLGEKIISGTRVSRQESELLIVPYF